MRRKPLNFIAWIALSAQGHPAPYLGMAFTRKGLREAYIEKFGGDIERAGYTLQKVQIVSASRQEVR